MGTGWVVSRLLLSLCLSTLQGIEWTSATGPADRQSLLQLNLIDSDGSLADIVFPGKHVALDLHVDHGVVGPLIVTECTVSNPVEEQGRPFLATILQYRCAPNRTRTRTRVGVFQHREGGYRTPLFPVPVTWARQAALLFSCRLEPCPGACAQPCPQPPASSALFHGSLVLDSQVVTSCSPHVQLPGCESRWSTAAPGNDGGATSGADVKAGGADVLTAVSNITKSGADVTAGVDDVMSNATDVMAVSAWRGMAERLPYVAVVSLLSLLAALFLGALIYQTAVLRARGAGGKTTSGDVTTQTAGNHHGRQGGDGASASTFTTQDGELSGPGGGGGVQRRGEYDVPPASHSPRARASDTPRGATAPAATSGPGERGVALGINSLRRHRTQERPAVPARDRHSLVLPARDRQGAGLQARDGDRQSLPLPSARDAPAPAVHRESAWAQVSGGGHSPGMEPASPPADRTSSVEPASPVDQTAGCRRNLAASCSTFGVPVVRVWDQTTRL